jgi:hypothetical protein
MGSGWRERQLMNESLLSRILSRGRNEGVTKKTKKC